MLFTLNKYVNSNSKFNIERVFARNVIYNGFEFGFSEELSESFE